MADWNWILSIPASIVFIFAAAADTHSPDAVVVGAGTAGCYAAATIARADYEVVIVERKSEDEAGHIACGDALKGASAFPEAIPREQIEPAFTNTADTTRSSTSSTATISRFTRLSESPPMQLNPNRTSPRPSTSSRNTISRRSSTIRSRRQILMRTSRRWSRCSSRTPMQTPTSR